MASVLVVTPYKGEKRELKYAYAAFHHSLARGELPFSPVLQYTDGGFGGRLVEPVGPSPYDVARAWIGVKPSKVVFYMDLGFTNEMDSIMQMAKSNKIPINRRYF